MLSGGKNLKTKCIFIVWCCAKLDIAIEITNKYSNVIDMKRSIAEIFKINKHDSIKKYSLYFNFKVKLVQLWKIALVTYKKPII